MSKKPRKPRKQSQVVNYDSDDERAYETDKVPDRQARDFYYDEIDEFHANKEKILLDQGSGMEPAEFSSDDNKDVVLGLGSDDSDSDIGEFESKLSKLQQSEFTEEMASDLEDNQDDGLPSAQAWGKKKSKFYGADVEDERDLDFSGSDVGAAELEEKEAIALQKKMAEQMDEDDFGLDIFKTSKQTDTVHEEPQEDTVKIAQDLSKLSKREKLELLRKESPELMDLIDDYKTKLTEVKDGLQPVLNAIRCGEIPAGRGADYVETKVKLLLNYCVNINFYLMLKAKRIPVQNHPVISRLVQYRNLIKQLEPVDEEMKSEMDLIQTKLKNGETLNLIKPKDEKLRKVGITNKRKLHVDRKTKLSQKKLSHLVSESDSSSAEDVPSGGASRKRKKKGDGQYETQDEKEALEYYDMMKAGRTDKDKGADSCEEEEAADIGEMAEHNEEGEDMKRGITYQIEKNKGLTPHRKKEYRNPRVKYRMKFKKAKIRRKGQVRETRTEMNRYGGEISGIRAGIKRSIKLKS